MTPKPSRGETLFFAAATTSTPEQRAAFLAARNLQSSTPLLAAILAP